MPRADDRNPLTRPSPSIALRYYPAPGRAEVAGLQGGHGRMSVLQVARIKDTSTAD